MKKIGQRKVSKCIFHDAARWVQILSEINFFINFKFISNLFLKKDGPPLWQYGLWSFQTGGTKLEIFLPKNQHTQMKL